MQRRGYITGQDELNSFALLRRFMNPTLAMSSIETQQLQLFHLFLWSWKEELKTWLLPSIKNEILCRILFRKTWNFSPDWEGKWNPVEQFSNTSGLFIHALRASLTFILYLNIWMYRSSTMSGTKNVLKALPTLDIGLITYIRVRQISI